MGPSFSGWVLDWRNGHIELRKDVKDRQGNYVMITLQNLCFYILWDKQKQIYLSLQEYKKELTKKEKDECSYCRVTKINFIPKFEINQKENPFFTHEVTEYITNSFLRFSTIVRR